MDVKLCNRVLKCWTLRLAHGRAQSGFDSGESTTFQLLHTYHTFCEAVENGKEVRPVFCDISKAFDRDWHKRLLHTLRGIGCSGKVLALFSSYLSVRRQRVVLNGKFSKWVEVLALVPQGSILGPFLFLIFINDIVKRIGGSIRLFVDDTSLYIIVDQPEHAARVLNADLQTISQWTNDWLVLRKQNHNYGHFAYIKCCPTFSSFHEWHHHCRNYK